MPAGSILLLVFVLFAIAVPLALWALIDAETSNPTVLDRDEAERLARERGGRGAGTGGRGTGRGGRDRDERSGASRDEGGDRDEWGSRDEWGHRGDGDRRR